MEMGNSDGPHSAQLVIDLNPELQRKIEAAAARRELAVPEFVIETVQRALEREPEEGDDEGAAWAQLSMRSFARDWDSEEDQVYDRLS
jgi:hypothetical protein